MAVAVVAGVVEVEVVGVVGVGVDREQGVGVVEVVILRRINCSTLLMPSCHCRFVYSTLHPNPSPFPIPVLNLTLLPISALTQLLFPPLTIITDADVVVAAGARQQDPRLRIASHRNQ